MLRIAVPAIVALASAGMLLISPSSATAQGGGTIEAHQKNITRDLTQR